MSSSKKFLVVGAGFSGAVLARRLAEAVDAEIVVQEQRDHIAGNCYTSRDPETDIMVHHFGPHIFNTSRKEVWEYIQKFGEFVPFVNRVKAVTSSGVYSLPVNLHTINQFFGTQLNPAAAQALIDSKADETITYPANFEEQALRMMGTELYQAFFYGYTRKQWGCEPSELPASILKRLPMRFDYNDNYYHADFQAIPRDGYTSVVSKMLDHSRIRLLLSSRFDRESATGYDHIFYTGPIDEYFAFKSGRLGYRTVTFVPFRGVGDHLGNAVLNYPEMSVPYTRVHEHKHFTPWEKHDKTIWFEEYSKETEADDVPFYPKRLAGDMAILKAYGEMAEEESKTSFLGRLGTYRYLNMDHAIGEALDFSATVIAAIKTGNKLPVLPAGVSL